MTTKSSPQHQVEIFISRWRNSGASERANYQLFITELCEVLQVEKPRPATDRVHQATYCFERPVEFNDGEGKKTVNFIDLYKKNCFILEAKQGSDKPVVSEAELLGANRIRGKLGTATRETRNWERHMKGAKEQALRYARSLPTSEGWPPFLVVVDVGFCIDIYSDFARQGKIYIPFPDPTNYRIRLEDLRSEVIRERLKLLFESPLELDPSKRAAKVTRQLAERLAKLAALLEKSGHSPQKVAGFLMRCLFTMFAEDVELLPNNSFTSLLKDYKTKLEILPQALQSLWVSMDKGGFDPALRSLIPQFNGFLFKDCEALPLSEAQIELLILASEADWSEVEPAIFGTFLERALAPRERHKLGAHYTPRAYVERLVMPTVIEPLRDEWEAARTASLIQEANGNDIDALREIEKFHRRLCSIKILDPACGSGNFLYVTLEHLKRLEGEVTEYIAHFPRQLDLDMTGGYTVTPAQFLGLEINPRAAAIADVVLWIGYLQWHFRTHGHAKRLENPILRHYGNIIQQDAVLSFSKTKPRFDKDGAPITRWDGHSTIQHPITGLEVPDDSARTPLYDFFDPKPAKWPEADFIIGNPPFVGNKKMRISLSDGYTEALRKAYKEVPESADFVVYWWYKAADLVRNGKVERFGFITTSRITQPFNRIVIQNMLENQPPLQIVYAIPDHPWVDTAEGAAVRIAMTVASNKANAPQLSKIRDGEDLHDELKVVELVNYHGKINADLTVGINLTRASVLKANQDLAYWGVKLYGKGFILSMQQAQLLEKTKSSEIIKAFISGRDLAQKPRGLKVIDSDQMDESTLRDNFPDAYQHLLINVKPERDQNPREKRKQRWWVYGENQPAMRKAINGTRRYIATGEVLKHRVFQFYDTSILPEGKVCVFAIEDAYALGILSSRFHVTWSAAIGGRLGVGNDLVYVKSKCFDTFPFPNVTDAQRISIRALAEKLDTHRKSRQALYPLLTITEMYNVLEKIRKGEKLTDNERLTHDLALISVLKEIHELLDLAVAAAYGWSSRITEEEILKNILYLNENRLDEEQKGLIRWLRPEYQNPEGVNQGMLNVSSAESKFIPSSNETLQWPKELAEQAQAVQRLIQKYEHPISADFINVHFLKVTPHASKIREVKILRLLETLKSLGFLRKTAEELYVR